MKNPWHLNLEISQKGAKRTKKADKNEQRSIFVDTESSMFVDLESIDYSYLQELCENDGFTYIRDICRYRIN